MPRSPRHRELPTLPPRMIATWSDSGSRAPALLVKALCDGGGVPLAHFVAREPVAGTPPRTPAGSVMQKIPFARLAAEGLRGLVLDLSSEFARRSSSSLQLSALLITSNGGALDAGALAPLVRRVEGTGVVVIPSDIALPRTVASALRGRVLTYGTDTRALVRGVVRNFGSEGAELDVTTPVGSGSLMIRRVGASAIRDTLGAIAVAISAGVPLPVVLDTASQVKSIRGVMERVSEGSVAAFVHDIPNRAALATAVADLRGMGVRRVHLVLGVEGDRDPEPRAKLAAAAVRLCDMTWLTMSHSRSEDPARIALSMVDGLKGSVRCELEFDRSRAIRMAVAAARPGDAVLVASQGWLGTALEVGDRLVPCDERALLRDMLGAGVPA